MKQLSTIQKREKLNDVFAVDEIGPGGANHLYCVYKAGTATLIFMATRALNVATKNTQIRRETRWQMTKHSLRQKWIQS